MSNNQLDPFELQRKSLEQLRDAYENAILEKQKLQREIKSAQQASPPRKKIFGLF